tara:strand:- start:74 stop:460 length:387 start_codon:yes stop_codon:yes gene_type:complete
MVGEADISIDLSAFSSNVNVNTTLVLEIGFDGAGNSEPYISTLDGVLGSGTPVATDVTISQDVSSNITLLRNGLAQVSSDSTVNTFVDGVDVSVSASISIPSSTHSAIIPLGRVTGKKFVDVTVLGTM